MHDRYVTVHFDGVWSRIDRGGWASGWASLSFHIKWPADRDTIRYSRLTLPDAPRLDYSTANIGNLLRDLSHFRGGNKEEGVDEKEEAPENPSCFEQNP